ncbi:hypothetical protein OIV83_005744 [Microbotryomycetes sp. JL201]|nr:hypothetical protein OIV83_005744 [Microbotryomycetes sp. JL201]
MQSGTVSVAPLKRPREPSQSGQDTGKYCYAYDSDDALEDADGLSSSDSDFTYEDYDPETGRREFDRVDESDDDSETSTGQIDFDRGNLQANKLDAEDLDTCFLDTVAHHSVDLESDEEWLAAVFRRRNRAKSRAKALATARPLSQSHSHSPKKTFQYANDHDAKRKRSIRRTEIAKQNRALLRQSTIARHTETLQDFAQEWQAVMKRQAELASSEELASLTDGKARLRWLLRALAPQYELDSREEVSVHHPLAAYLISRAQVLEALCHLAAKPLTADLISLPGIMKTEAPHSLRWDQAIDRSGRIHVYLRVLKASVAQHRQWSRNYTDAYPTAYIREAPFLAATADLGPDDVCQRMYAGLSVKTDGAGRAMQDEGTSGAHVCNFISANGLSTTDFTYYELVLEGKEWRLEPDTVHELRANALASSLEDLAIAVLGPARLNSHPGGLVSNLKADKSLIDVLSNVNDALAAAAAEPPYRPDQTRRSRVTAAVTLNDIRREDRKLIERHVDDCARAWISAVIDSGPKLSRTAIEEIKTNASGIEYSHDGYPLSVRCLKDVTRAEFMVESTGSTFFGRLAGHGPRLFVDTLKLVHRHVVAPAASVDHGLGDVASFGASFMNFWIILRHKKVILAIILWLRYISCVMIAPVLIVTSAKLAALVYNGFIHSKVPWSELMQAGVLTSCLDKFDSALLIASEWCHGDVVWDDLPLEWDDLPLDNYLGLVGSVLVINIRPGDWRLVVFQLDFGAVKYDPLLAPIYRRLLSLVEAKVRVAQCLGGLLRPALDQDSLKALPDAIAQVCHDSGLERQLSETRERARTLNLALSSLRKTAAHDRQLISKANSLISAGALSWTDAERAASQTLFKEHSLRASAAVQGGNARAERALGPPNSEARQMQAATLAAIPTSPAPDSCPLGSREWMAWFLNLNKVVILMRSAQAFGQSVYDRIRDDPVKQQQYRDSREQAEGSRLF